MGVDQRCRIVLTSPRVPSGGQRRRLRPSGVIETFIGPGEQTATPIQRIILAATMPHRLVLDPRGLNYR